MACSNKQNKENKSIGQPNIPKTKIYSSTTSNFLPRASKTTITDLNGDNVLDTLIFSLDSMSIERYLLTVNNCSLIGDGCCAYDSVLIIDIDTADDFKEIAVCKGEPDDFYLTTFYWYSGTKVEVVGTVDEEYSKNMAKGNGEIHIDKINYFLGRRSYPATYCLEPDHKLYEYEEKWIDPEISVVVKKHFGLWRYSSDFNSKITVDSSEIVTFVKTDLKKWILVMKDNGKKGWLFVDENDNVNGTKLQLKDIFDGFNYDYAN